MYFSHKIYSEVVRFVSTFLVSNELAFSVLYIPLRGSEFAIGTATRYGLDGLGIESRWGANFPPPVQTGPEAYPAFYTVGTESLPGVKRPESGVDNPPPV